MQGFLASLVMQIAGESLKGLAPQLLDIAGAVIKGLVAILVDLIGTASGRAFVLGLAILGGGYYAVHNYTYVNRAELAALTAKAAELSKLDAAGKAVQAQVAHYKERVERLANAADSLARQLAAERTKCGGEQ